MFYSTSIRHVGAAAALLLCGMPTLAAPQSCQLGPRRTLPISERQPRPHYAYSLGDGSVAFLGRLTIDADGAPKAYHKDSRLGLDRLANGGVPGNWWALATDAARCEPSGQPIVQNVSDPAPGFYVSKTSMVRPGGDCRRQRTYVDSSSIPYIALSPAVRGSNFTAQRGHLAAVHSLRTGRTVLAIFADGAPRDGRGEGSIALAEALGYDGSPRSGGTKRRELIYLVLPARMGFAESSQAVRAAATPAFAAWGGETRLADCARKLTAAERRP